VKIFWFQADEERQKEAAASIDEISPERQQELERKVQELKARLEAKKQARARYDAYMERNDCTANISTTDYHKWDLWCPEDEDDELLAKCTPNNEQMKAMEKDIDERHARCDPLDACTGMHRPPPLAPSSNESGVAVQIVDWKQPAGW
jgi:hypothetical protein